MKKNGSNAGGTRASRRRRPGRFEHPFCAYFVQMATTSSSLRPKPFGAFVEADVLLDELAAR